MNSIMIELSMKNLIFYVGQFQKCGERHNSGWSSVSNEKQFKKDTAKIVYCRMYIIHCIIYI